MNDETTTSYQGATIFDAGLNMQEADVRAYISLIADMFAEQVKAGFEKHPEDATPERVARIQSIQDELEKMATGPLNLNLEDQTRTDSIQK